MFDICFPAICKNTVTITTAGKEKGIFWFFTLFILYILSFSISSEYLAVSLFSVCFLSHSNRRKSKDKERKKTFTRENMSYSNPKNSAHSEEVINKLNNILWKQTLLHKCKTRNENLRVMANHNINMSQQSNAVTKKKTQILIFRKSGTHKKWEIIALFIQPL